MKKVLFTSHLANFVKFNKPFMKWFQEQGWEVHYASLDEEEIPYCDQHFKVQFHRSPYSPDNIKAYFQLKKLIDAEHYDIIHCHTPMGGVVTRLAAMGARRRGTKVIYTAHGFHFYKGAPKLNWLLYYPMEKILSRFTDCLVTMNAEDYDAAQSHGFRARLIRKIDGVGVDLSRFRPAASEIEQIKLRNEWGYDSASFILICVAEFTKNKNQCFLLQSFASLVKIDSTLRLIFVGRGEELEPCKKLAAELGLLDTVQFAGYRTDVERIDRISDVCVSASYREGFPVNFLEAMASGLPIVCSAVRGQIDIVQDDYNGYLFDVDDIEKYCKLILTLASQYELRKKIAKNNLEIVQQYSQDTVVQAMARIYAEVQSVSMNGCV